MSSQPVRLFGLDPGVAPTGCLLLVSNGQPWAVEFWERSDTSHELRDSKGRLRIRTDAGMLRLALEEAAPDIVVLEEVGPRPHEGAASSWRFAFAAGICEAVPLALRIRTEHVRPNAWRKVMKVTPGKDGSRAAACALAPHLAQHFKRVADHNRADAFLLAAYGLRELQGGRLSSEDT